MSDITCDIKLYADHTTLFTVRNKHHNKPHNLTRAEEWANEWLATFYHTKTKLLTITLKIHNSSDNHTIISGNEHLTEVSK